MGRKKPEPKAKPKRPKEEKRWLSLPKLEGVLWIWADGWWDYVLSGVCEHDGKRYYAVCVDENYDKRFKWFRRYLVVDLPEDVWAEENARHEFFVEKVGSHFEFDKDKQVRKRDELKNSRTWMEFYERYPCPTSMGGEVRDYKQYTHVGWFEK